MNNYLDNVNRKRQEAAKKAEQERLQKQALDTTKQGSDKVAAEVARQAARTRTNAQPVELKNSDLARTADIDKVIQELKETQLATLLSGSQKPSVILADSTDLGDKVAQLGTQITQAIQSASADTSQVEAIRAMADEYKSVVTAFVALAKSQQTETLKAVKEVGKALDGKDFTPQVTVEAPKVEVPAVDVKPLADAISKLETAIKANKVVIPKSDFSSLSSDVKAVTKAINSLSFPVPNYILPFKDPTTGKATQVTLDSSGNVPITGSISVDTTGLATSAKQSDGSQKTQIVDAGGEAATVTGGKLDVNATASLAGESLPIAGATEAVGVAIVDGSGDQITSFGGGVQYTEGDTDATITGTVVMVEDGSDTLRAVTGNVANGMDVDVTRVSGTVTVDGSGVTQPVSNAGLTELAAAINASSQVDVNIAAGNITGYATSAKQDTIIGHVDGIEGILGTIDADTGNISTKIDTVAGAVSGTEMQVDVVAALPAGNNNIGDVDIASLPNEGQQTMANSISVAIASNQSAVPVDGSGVTQPISHSALTELGTAIGNTNANQLDVYIKGSAVATGGTSAADDDDFTDGTTPGTPGMGVYESTPSTVTDGDLGVVGITQDRQLKVNHPGLDKLDDGTVELTAFQGGGSWDVNVGPISISQGGNTAAVLDLTTNDGLAVAILDGNGDQITSFGGGTQYTEGDTDATITGTAMLWEDGSDTLRAVSAAKPLPVDLQDASVAVTNGGTFATQVDGSALTALQLIDDPVATLGTTTYTETTTKGMIMGAVRRDADTTLVDTTNEVSPLQVDANGRLKVEAFSGETLPVSLTSTTVTAISAGDNNIGNVDIVTLPGDVEADIDQIRDQIDLITPDIEEIRVDADAIRVATELIDNSVFVDDADFSDGVSTGLGIMGVAENTPTTVTDGDMGMVGIDPATRAMKIHDGGNTITVDGTVTANLSATDNTVLDNIDADTSAIQTATELLDDTVFVDDADWTADTSKHLLVGGVTQVATTANTDGDVTPLTTNAFRELRVAIPESDLATAGTAHVKKYYTSAGAATDGIIWSPAAGKRWYVTDIFINVSAAATVTLEDDKAGGDEAVWKAELAANSGWSHHFGTPLYSGEDAADLIITTSAGNVYVTVTGYEI